MESSPHHGFDPSGGRSASLPTGTVTFLFTDIVGSTRLWERYPQRMSSALDRHNAILEQAAGAYGAHIFKKMGDAFCLVFQSPADGLAVALTGQRALQDEAWVEIDPLQVRMALHTGVCNEQDGDYFGPAVNRVARLLAVAHGGQILLSQTTLELLRDQPPPGIVWRDLGLHRLKDLTRPEHVYQVVAPDLPADFQPLATLDFHPNNLPIQATTFIGRERQLEQLTHLLNRNRLLTLTGPGGTGKTRLALQVAAEMVEAFPDGVTFVSLAQVSDPSLVAQTMADTLGIEVSRKEEPLEALKEYLQPRQALLVLDNFEHLLGAAPLAPDLLNVSPSLRIITTSREPLHLYGEQEYFVPPLELPAAQSGEEPAHIGRSEAVRLFLNRARAVKPDFELGPENASTVGEICRRLDGLPLAIELVSARVKSLPVSTLLERIDESLSMLTGGPRDLPDRQQTLRNTIAWSYGLLNEAEQALFRQLAVFCGGASLEAVESVCSIPSEFAILDLLCSLVDKSIIQQVEGPGTEPRFIALETIRAFAWERLVENGEEETMRKRHLDFFLALGESASPQLLTGQDASLWFSRIDVEQENIRAALAWALGAGDKKPADAGRGATLAGAIYLFYATRGFLNEGRRWLELAVERVQDGTRTRARALTGAGCLAWQQGDYDVAQSHLGEAVAILRDLEDKFDLAEAVHFLGHLTFDQKSYLTAREQFSESLALYQELGDESCAVVLSKDLGLVAYHEGDYTAAQFRFEAALAYYRRNRSTEASADVMLPLGDLARLAGDFHSSTELYREALGHFCDLGATLGIASCHHKLGQVALSEGEIEPARKLLSIALDLQLEAGNKQGIAECLAAMAGLCVAAGEVENAVRLFGALDTFLESLGAPLAPADRVDLEAAQKAAHCQLGQLAFDRLWTEGRSFSLEEALALAT